MKSRAFLLFAVISMGLFSSLYFFVTENAESIDSGHLGTAGME
jgi:hypothetical protein